MRDAQRQRVYDAESVAQKTLKEMGIIKTPVTPMSLEEMKAVLQKMNLFNVEVNWFRGGATHCAYFNYNHSISMIPRMAHMWNIIHEGCHALVHRSYPAPWKVSSKVSLHSGVWCGGENNSY